LRSTLSIMHGRREGWRSMRIAGAAALLIPRR
jgi:hypothetical protein